MALLCWAGASVAADVRPDVANKGVIELETTESAGISIRIAEDLAALIDDGATRRVLPVVGPNSRQALFDLIQLRGIDMAILQTDVLDSVRQQNALPGLGNNLTYIAKLYNEEFHLLAGPDVKTIADLAHHKVNVGLRGSGTGVTATRLFDLLKIPVEFTYDRPDTALEKLRHGDIAAMAFVGGKPVPLFQNVSRDGGYHFVSVPLEKSLVSAYLPSTLSAEDYPGLVATDQPVDTVAVGTLLAVAKLSPGSERYRNASNFVEIFFTQFRALLEPGHQKKWHETNFAAEVPGWTRFPPAQQWLDRNASVARQNPEDFRAMFSTFLDTRQQALGATPISEQQKQELFNQFQRWQAGQAR
jgi:TRAP-type uncharacterized transport system substrate-binding protein